MVFLDLEKAFDRVNRNQLWQILNRRGTPYHEIGVIKSLYKNTSIQIDTGRKIIEKIYILIKEYEKGVIYHRLFLTFT
jgi:hypothetical protein